MLTWNWKQKVGHFIVEQRLANHEEVQFEITMYKGNCLCVNVWKCSNDKDEDKYAIFDYWCDMKHLKNCLGLSKGFKKNLYGDVNNKMLEIHLNIYFKEMLKVAELFAKIGVKVVLYYEVLDTLSE